MSLPPAHLIIEKPLNISGKFRLCEHAGCEKYIPCPYVKCEEHRTDMAKQESVVKAWGE